jgi:hypothetical protein
MVLLFALALAAAAQQDSSVIDAPVYSSAEWGVSMRRPFDDWVFSPATARGTTTVIFQPRDGSLSDQLWGALVLSSWGREVPLQDVATRRTYTNWRATLGSSFRLLTRDSLDVAGLPAIHLVMTGAIERAVVDIEEYLVARDSDLIALQFRYPRGQPRDSISAGYLRSLASLAIRARPPSAPSAPPARAASPVSAWSVALERDRVLFDLPAEYQAVAPGWLSSEVTSQGRRLMRWTPLIGGADTALYAIGRFRLEPRRIGRLTLRAWRSLSTDSSLTRVTDDMLFVLARAWAVYWRDFGPVPTAEVSVVETAWSQSRGGPGVVYLGADARQPGAAASILRRELARSWWGGMVKAEGPAARLVGELLPAWSAALAGDSASSPESRTIERIRTTAGDAAFREAIRTLIAESRGGPPAISSFLALLGEEAAAGVRAAIR